MKNSSALLGVAIAVGMSSTSHASLSKTGEKAAQHLSDLTKTSFTIEEKEALAVAEKMAIMSTATASLSPIMLMPTYLYCLKTGISIGFQLGGADCVDGFGNRKSIGFFGLGGYEASAQAAVLIAYSAIGDSVNGIYSDAKGVSIGLLAGGSGVRYGKKQMVDQAVRLAGSASMYAVGFGVGLTVLNQGQLSITDPE